MRRGGRRGRYNYWGEYYEYRPTIKAKGGIKAQSKRGGFGESWWAKRWIATLESFNIGGRLGRGMPREIEQSFKDAGLSLFPEKLGDLQTNCSCPDWSNPCKHIAAVYYLLGEEFDRDPFVIFKLRGISGEKFIKLLAAAGETQRRRVAEAGRTRGAAPSVAVPPQPLAADVASFWSGSTLPDDFFGEVSAPPVSAALPKRLGNFSFWRGTGRFLDAGESVYVQASPRGLDAFLGEAEAGAQSSARADRPRPP